MFQTPFAGRTLLLLTMSLALAACGTTQSSSDPETLDGSDLSGPDGSLPETELRKFPGVTVQEVNGGVRIRLRGTSTFSGDEDPLFIVDGARIQLGPGGALVGIRRADITEIRVLKSASETSSYGPQALHGVVIVTTRTGASER